MHKLQVRAGWPPRQKSVGQGRQCTCAVSYNVQHEVDLSATSTSNEWEADDGNGQTIESRELELAADTTVSRVNCLCDNGSRSWELVGPKSGMKAITASRGTLLDTLSDGTRRSRNGQNNQALSVLPNRLLYCLGHESLDTCETNEI